MPPVTCHMQEALDSLFLSTLCDFEILSIYHVDLVCWYSQNIHILLVRHLAPPLGILHYVLPVKLSWLVHTFAVSILNLISGTLTWLSACHVDWDLNTWWYCTCLHGASLLKNLSLRSVVESMHHWTKNCKICLPCFLKGVQNLLNIHFLGESNMGLSCVLVILAQVIQCFLQVSVVYTSSYTCIGNVYWVEFTQALSAWLKNVILYPFPSPVKSPVAHSVFSYSVQFCLS